MKVLPFQTLLDGHEKTIVNAHRLLESAMTLVDERPEVSLGLAELGQEEIGKSLSIMAAFALPEEEAPWDWFWSAWKDHNLKAHRAYLYELISPLRVEILNQDGSPQMLPSSLGKLPSEKEHSFYVNFDQQTQRFTLPEDELQFSDIANRVFTLYYLGSTARAVRLALDDLDVEFAYRSFSEIALLICSSNVLQEHMPSIFADFANRSSKHKEIISHLRERFVERKEALAKLFAHLMPLESLEFF
jgi:AbiV family abortive infection protein